MYIQTDNTGLYAAGTCTVQKERPGSWSPGVYGIF